MRLRHLPFHLAVLSAAQGCGLGPLEPGGGDENLPLPVAYVTAATRGRPGVEYIYVVRNAEEKLLLPGRTVSLVPTEGSVELAGVPAGCDAEVNPRTVSLARGDTTRVHFQVDCTGAAEPVAAAAWVFLDRNYVLGLDALGRSARVLASGVSPVWRHDGARIAFISDATGQRRVTVLDPEAGTTTPVSGSIEPNDATGPLLSWSPDGTRIAVGDGPRLLLLDAGGGTPDVIEPNLGTIGSLDWSPQGNAVVVTSDSGLAIVPLDGGTRYVLVGTDPYRDVAPSWSPDGSHIAFARATPTTTCPCPITFPHLPTWSRAAHPTLRDLYTIGAAEGEPAQILEMTGEGGGFAWSPDGSHLAFTGQDQLLRLGVPGRITIPVSLGIRGIPSWTPDGRIRVHSDEGISTVAPDGSGRVTIATGQEARMVVYLGPSVVWRP